jgi:predicted DNA-binding protein
MTISITLTPDQERKLEALARQNGQDPSSYVNDVVTAYLNGVESKKEKTFEEILSPVWEGWRQSGMTEEEIDDLFRQELQEVREERRERKGTT